MAEDFQLWLDVGDGGAHSIDAPRDMPVHEFIADVRKSLEIKDDRQILYCKELGRDLERMKTLADNGVEDANHLFLRRPVSDGVVVPPVVGGETADRRWMWFSAAALAMILVGWLAYAAGARSVKGGGSANGNDVSRYVRANEEQAKQIQSLQQELAAAHATLKDRDTLIAQSGKAPDELRQELVRTRRDLESGQSREQVLRSRLEQMEAQARDLKAQVERAGTQSPQDRAQIANLRGEVERLEGENTRLRADLQVLRGPANKIGDNPKERVRYFPQTKNVPASGTIWWTGQVENGQTIVIDDGKASEGSIRGDMLPGVPVRIVSLVPGEIGVAESPQPSNGWKRLALRSKISNRVVVVINWATVNQ